MDSPNSAWLSLLRFVNRKTRDSRVIRRAGIPTYSFLMRANVFFPPPRVLLNGPAKSGTHLLSDCISLMPKMMFSGRHFALPEFFKQREAFLESGGRYPALDTPGLKRFLARCPRGMFVTAHAWFHPILEELLEELEFKHILLLRDPRDIVVSHVFYVKRERLNLYHRYYTEKLQSDEERISATIQGFNPMPPYNVTLLGLDQRLDRFIRWAEEPSTLVVRFEDLIGPGGNSTFEAQIREIERIGYYIERPLSRLQSQRIAEGMYGKRSLTFRKGQQGDWRNHFTEEHKKIFKEIAGEELIQLGYEKDFNW